MENSIPQHIVLFPDGNRRWARGRGFHLLEGHKAGYEKLVDFVNWCRNKGVRVVTVFGFSTENWNRTKEEVSYLMKLLEMGLRTHIKDFASKDRGARVRVIGERKRLPESLQEAIHDVEEQTRNQDAMFLNLAISYGGRWDIVQAAQKYAQYAIDNKTDSHVLTEKYFSQFLCLYDLPEPDLLIRTSGEKRISNFMLWQFAYTEFCFIDTLWPDFDETVFSQVINDFQKRERRFGLISEQIATQS